MVVARTSFLGALHRSMHLRADGRHVPQIVIALTQSTTVPADPETGTPEHVFRGGSTLIIDLTAAVTRPELAVKYCIVKRIQSRDRQRRTAAFFRGAAADPLRALLYAPDRKEPFAALHALAD